MRNISKEIAANNMKKQNKNKTKQNQKKAGLDGYECDCSVDCNTIDIRDSINTQEYLIKKQDIK